MKGERGGRGSDAELGARTEGKCGEIPKYRKTGRIQLSQEVLHKSQQQNFHIKINTIDENLET